ncbi:MAG: thiosulfohydrolase SoxB [Gammaproteobacteria bacterium]|nr:thiosulfohydrolase SoxB [Gammaproteobacteria bacterium]
MSLSRREFIQMMGLAAAAGLVPGCNKSGKSGAAPASAVARKPEELYNIAPFGNVSLIHFTDSHAQLLPIYFREPNVNVGLATMSGVSPHLVGDKFLKHFGIHPGSIEAHAFTYLNFEEAAKTFGKVGGFAHLRTLIKKLRSEHGVNKTLLMDGGDTWQGSGTAYWTRGKDMVGACNLLGVDVMTGHWEFTYQDKEVIENVKNFKGDFVCQNVFVNDESILTGYPFADFAGFNESTQRAFKPYSIKQVGEVRVAVIGQAFPYTPIANPQRFIPHWTFGIHDQDMQRTVDEVRNKEKADIVVVISHNGMDVDLKMAELVSGIDVIFGGHTHDGVPAPTVIKNKTGQTLVTNAGSNGKFLGFMQLDVRNGKLQDFRYRLLPVFSNLLEPDKEMQGYIADIRKPYEAKLTEQLAIADPEGVSLYRRGNFNGTFDQVICDALRAVNQAQISLSPGFRWGTTVLPGQTVTMDHVMDQTATTYPETYVRDMSGDDIKIVLEDVADNLFNTDPYKQQGGDMVRLGGMDYTIDLNASIGNRIKDMRLDNGTPIDAKKSYKVAGWATVGSQSPGEPVWDTVAKYLRDVKVAKIKKFNTPKIIGAQGNAGIADYKGELG